MKLDSMRALYLDELADIYNAEQQLVDALPKMARAAHHPQLKLAFEHHLAETEAQVERLEGLFDRMSTRAPRKTCKAMKGLVAEGAEMIKQKGDPAVLDAGLIGAAQRVEHYEIAAYGCARTYARLLGDRQAVAALETSLDEEKAADAKLNELAESVVNPEAVIA